jgi:hypothetical protein
MLNKQAFILFLFFNDRIVLDQFEDNLVWDLKFK